MLSNLYIITSTILIIIGLIELFTAKSKMSFLPKYLNTYSQVSNKESAKRQDHFLTTLIIQAIMT